MSKRQELIKQLIRNSRISQAWYARKIGLKPQTLSYHLNESPELNLDLYNQLIKELALHTDVKETEKDFTPGGAIEPESKTNQNNFPVSENNAVYLTEYIQVLKEHIEVLEKELALCRKKLKQLNGA